MHSLRKTSGVCPACSEECQFPALSVSRIRIHIVTDDICETALGKVGQFDYSNMVEVINRFGRGSEPWQFQKVECLMDASRNGWILMDADTIWHGEPKADPEMVTLLVKAYDFGVKEDERDFLLKNDMTPALSWPHFVTGFVSLPPALYSEELASLAMEWTKRAFSDERLKANFGGNRSQPRYSDTCSEGENHDPQRDRWPE